MDRVTDFHGDSPVRVSRQFAKICVGLVIAAATSEKLAIATDCVRDASVRA
jgi:hypothetical protein